MRLRRNHFQETFAFLLPVLATQTLAFDVMFYKCLFSSNVLNDAAFLLLCNLFGFMKFSRLHFCLQFAVWVDLFVTGATHRLML